MYNIKNISKTYFTFLLFILVFSCSSTTKNNKIFSKSMIVKDSSNREIATFAGGCFWCLETTFARLKGVDTVLSGYIGGKVPNPTYEQICTGNTGHAEAVQIVYDSSVIDFNTLLTVFFSLHDPTTLNRQGGDIGTQYRSEIFYHNESQKTMAELFIKQLTDDAVFEDPIVTQMSAYGIFYQAEDYHQNYYNLNRTKNAYCVAVIDPKVAKMRKSFAHLLKE